VGDSHRPLRVGSRVLLRSHSWTVQAVTEYPDCASLRVTGCGGTDHGTKRTFILPFDRVKHCGAASRLRVVGRRSWSHHVAQAFTSTHPFGGLRAAAHSAIDLLPFQLEPALAMLRHARLRILIADEVGLGKTVQAGIVLNELAHADSGFRSIVLCPAGLREQWQRELASKFSLETTLADAAWLAECARELPADVNPWSLPGVYVASLDLVKRPEVLRAIEDVTWDLSVIDEVHALGPETARLAAARAIGARSRRLLAMTATPPDGDATHLAAITDIGRGAGEPAITEFRRTRGEAAIDARRKSILLAIRLSSAEIRMHRLLERYTSLVWSQAAARGDHRARLAAMVLRKRALSSAASLSLSVKRRREIIGTAPLVAERQLLLPLGDEDPLADDLVDEVMAASGLTDVAMERACLEEIVASADEAARSESKMRALVRLLARIREPAIVFTEYRDTLAHIARALGSRADIMMLHGEIPPRERVQVQRAFNDSGGLLLATDAASEGLNLHHHCRLVIHFELPWNPMRLEQRTGRVDRLGQTRPVHEILLVARDTAERFVLAPLVRRIRTAAARGRRSLAALDEWTLAEVVIGGAPLDVPPDTAAIATAALDLREDAAVERARLAAVRAFTDKTNHHTQGNVLVCTGRSRSSPAAMTVWLLALKDRTGRVVHSELVAASVASSEAPAARIVAAIRDSTSRFIEHWQGPVVAAINAHSHASIELATTGVQQLVQALSRRERALAQALPAAQSLLQAGLFDRRSIRTAASRSAVSNLLQNEIEQRMRALEDEGRLDTAVRLVAVRWERR
jgi:superfamily II DNA or RNA helicase